jgi:hypothetical protein
VPLFLSAYAEAERLLGDVELTTGQLAQLRAIDMAHQRRLFALLHAAGPRRDPTEEEVAALRERIDADLLALLTPEQRRALGR